MLRLVVADEKPEGILLDLQHLACDFIHFCLIRGEPNGDIFIFRREARCEGCLSGIEGRFRFPGFTATNVLSMNYAVFEYIYCLSENIIS